MNMLTTVKTLAEVRQVLRGYAPPHPPEAEDYNHRRLAQRAPAKSKEKRAHRAPRPVVSRRIYAGSVLRGL